MRLTPLHEEHLALGATMVPFAGWDMPIQYPSGIVSEHRATRAAAGLFDLSHMGELWVRGDGAPAALDRLVSSDIQGLAVGHARYGLLTNQSGGIVDDVIVYRTAPGELLVVVNAANVEKDLAHLTERLTGAAITDASAETALVAIQGPRALAISGRVADAPLDDLASFGVRRTAVAGVECLAARTGYTGEDGLELFTPWGGAPTVWHALLDAGAGEGLVPVGLGARDTLRLEARLPLYGNEIDEATSPIEAGLGWACALDKPFLGRDEIARVKAEGPDRRLVGLIVDGGVARHAFPVLSDGVEIGRVTSGTYGPSVQKNIALAYVPSDRAKPGTVLAVRIRGRDVPATVARTPFRRKGEAA